MGFAVLVPNLSQRQKKHSSRCDHHWFMGARSSTPDLFSFASDRAASTASVNLTSNTSVRHILPNDLARAVKHLDDQELDRLLSAVLVEQKRRGKKHPDSDEISRKRQFKAVAIPLTQGKLNAVRAAFRAGVTPSRIARQFGISQSDVRKALASQTTKG
jgi:hypothetical protein